MILPAGRPEDLSPKVKPLAVFGAAVCGLALFSIPVLQWLASAEIPGVDFWILSASACLLGAIVSTLYLNRRDLIALPNAVAVCFLGYPLGAVFYVFGWNYSGDWEVFSRSSENRPYLLFAVILAGGAYMTFWGVYLLTEARTGRRARSPRPPAETELRILDRNRLHFIVGLFAALGTIAVLAFFHLQGGVGAYFHAQGFLRGAPVGSNYLDFAALLLPLSAVLWLGLDFRDARKRILFWLLAAFSMFYAFVLSTRWTIIGLAMILAVLGYRNRIFTRKKLIILVVFVIGISLVIGAARDMSQKGKAFTIGDAVGASWNAVSLRLVVYETVAGRNSTDVDLFAWIIRNYSFRNLKWGRTLLEIPLMVVPRSLWPNKPKEVGTSLVREYLRRNDLSLAWHPGLLGELHLNFHAAGVIGGMIVMGWLFGRIDRRRKANTAARPDGDLYYAVFLCKVVVMTIITGFMQPFILGMMYLVPLWIGCRFALVRPGRAGKERIFRDDEGKTGSAAGGITRT